VLICYGGNAKTIIFTQTKLDANSLVLSDKIKQDIEVMHGDIAQNQREVTMKRFKEGKFQVLVATDVAARGLDIQDIELVIQLEPPKDTETYIHRSGRTARAGKTGTCITFYSKKTYELVVKIEDLAGIKLKRVGIPQPEDVIKATSRDILKNLTDVNEDVVHLFEDTARVLIDQHDGDAEKALQVALAYCSGFYKNKLVSKSLLTGQEYYTTMKMSNARGGMGFRDAQSVLRKYWDPRVSDNVRNMKMFRNGNGVVFDIRSETVEAFLENFERLKETGDRIDFDICKCTDLPELEEDGYGSVSNWRSDNNSRGGGGGYGQNKGFSRGGGGGYQDRGYGGGGGGGGWDRRGGNEGGGYRNNDRGYDNRRDNYGGGDDSRENWRG